MKKKLYWNKIKYFLHYNGIRGGSRTTATSKVLQLYYRHLSSNKKDCTVKIWILISKFPLALFDDEVSLNINNCKWNNNIKSYKGSVWQYWLRLTSKAIPCFLKGLKFLRKSKTNFVKNFGNSWKWKMANLLRKWRIWPEQNFAKGTW